VQTHTPDDALKKLQIYGSVSSSKAEGHSSDKGESFPPSSLTTVPTDIIGNQDDEKHKLDGAATTVVGTPPEEECTPTGGRRPLTRSMSPMMAHVSSEFSPKNRRQRNVVAKIVADSPRRLTRFATAQAKANVVHAGMLGEPQVDLHNSMNRNLDHQFSTSETNSERKQRELIEDCPSFDLGFETQGNEGASAVETEGALKESQEMVIISSNEDSGDSLDKIYANVEMPVRTPNAVAKSAAEHVLVKSVGPNSSTPIPQAHKKRIVKPAQNQKSPYVECSKKEIATKYTNEVYNRVRAYGGETNDDLNKNHIIDNGSFYIHLRDLADSVRPGALLSNSTCEMALRVIAPEMAAKKKHVMPLWVAVSFQTAFYISVLHLFFSRL
jgi:hypothetical protein